MPRDGLSAPPAGRHPLAVWVHGLLGPGCLAAFWSGMRVSDGPAFLLLVLALGTQLLQYAVMQPGWTHAQLPAVHPVPAAGLGPG